MCYPTLYVTTPVFVYKLYFEMLRWMLGARLGFTPRHLRFSERFFTENPEHREVIEEQSFQRLGVTTALCRRLKNEFGITDPMAVQEVALPITLNRTSCIVQSQTGTGKSLTFLLPALQDSTPGLSTLVLTPTRELAHQLFSMATSLVGHGKRSKRIGLIVSELKGLVDDEEEEGKRDDASFDSNDPPDIVIGTPKAILEKTKNGHLSLKSLRRIVLDECDKILDPLRPGKTPWRKARTREWHPRPGALVLIEIKKVLKNREIQFICTSATADRLINSELNSLGWTERMQTVNCSKPKRVPGNIQHCYIVTNDKVATIAELIEAGRHPALAFIHRHAPINSFIDELHNKDIPAVALYSKTTDSEIYKDFIGRFRAGAIKLVVGTEETVRGLDFPWVSNVFLTEVPRNPKEYIHLCGRVGRIGRDGTAIVLVDEAKNELPRLLRQYASLAINNPCNLMDDVD